MTTVNTAQLAWQARQASEPQQGSTAACQATAAALHDPTQADIPSFQELVLQLQGASELSRLELIAKHSPDLMETDDWLRLMFLTVEVHSGSAMDTNSD